MTEVRTMEQKSRRDSDVHVVDGGGPRVAESCVINVSGNAKERGGREELAEAPDATVGNPILKGAV